MTLDFNSRLAPFEVEMLLEHLGIDGKVWSYVDFEVNGYKTYDEDGNSEHIGVLIVNTENKTPQDIAELESEIEEIIYTKLYPQDNFEDDF